MKYLFPAALAASPVAAQIDVSNDDLVFPGPYKAEITRVIDGDTVDMRVALWPGLAGVFAIRIRGIDAPELRRTGCEAEKRGGEAAMRQVENFAPPGTRMRLTNVEYGTFAGRVIADVSRATDGADLGRHLIEAKLAVEWTPERDEVPWCLLLRDVGKPVD